MQIHDCKVLYKAIKHNSLWIMNLKLMGFSFFFPSILGIFTFSKLHEY